MCIRDSYPPTIKPSALPSLVADWQRIEGFLYGMVCEKCTFMRRTTLLLRQTAKFFYGVVRVSVTDEPTAARPVEVSDNELLHHISMTRSAPTAAPSSQSPIHTARCDDLVELHRRQTV